jgi:hypothetical protein
LDFHNDFLCSIKNFFFRFKQNGIAAKNKWVQSDWDLKNSPQDEVIIVTDVKLKLFLHNIVNMNGYREEVLGKA